MRKRLALLAAAVLGTSAVVVGAVTTTSATAATTITVIEHASTDRVTDVGREGLGPGDLLTFHNAIYDSTDTTQVGTDHGSCIRLTKLKATSRARGSACGRRV